MKKIFVDMDGVLTNFDKKYAELFGHTPAEMRHNRDRKEYTSFWHTFVDKKAFAKLDKFPGADELLDFLSGLDPTKVQICILTSAGGFDRQRDVQVQKLKWLTDNGIFWPTVVVPGRRYKQGFASGDSFMIDDTADVIKGFCEHGGSGIVHTHAEITIPIVRKWLDPLGGQML